MRVAAAVDAQRALAAEPGRPASASGSAWALHTGEVEQRGGDYVGLDVHRAARHRARPAHGGQVLHLGATRGARRRRTAGRRRAARPGRAPPQGPRPPGAPLPARDRRPASRLPAAPDARRAAAATCPASSPASSAASARGRAASRRLLRADAPADADRPGGTGKTRLALQVAAELLDDVPRRRRASCRWHRSRDPELVAGTIAQTLGLREDGRDRLDRDARRATSAAGGCCWSWTTSSRCSAAARRRRRAAGAPHRS